jgi:hypothetical protein
MHRYNLVGFYLFLLSSSITSAASGRDETTFFHKDWELVCDNTGTCRAAGYQSDDDNGFPVSVLLTRKAGPKQPVKGAIRLGGEEDLKLEKGTVRMQLNGESLGVVKINSHDNSGALSERQTTAMLKALLTSTEIVFNARDFYWRLSDQGATAVLLKMDETQARVGTIGALVKKGNKSESGVKLPTPLPVVTFVSTGNDVSENDQWFVANAKSVLKEIIKKDSDNCDGLVEAKVSTLRVSKLSGSKLLLSTRCWAGAYNVGDGYWVVNDRPPYHPQFVTDSGTEYANGVITAAFKGRGLGDCWSFDTWVWNGNQFLSASSSQTGQCKGIPGGAWDLPTKVTQIQRK